MRIRRAAPPGCVGGLPAPDQAMIGEPDRTLISKSLEQAEDLAIKVEAELFKRHIIIGAADILPGLIRQIAKEFALAPSDPTPVEDCTCLRVASCPHHGFETPEMVDMDI